MNPRLASSEGRISGSAAMRWRTPNPASSTAPAARQRMGSAVQPVGRAVDQPVDQREHAGAEQARAQAVDGDGAGRPVAGQEPQRGQEPGGAQHDVDQEDRPPGQPGDVGADQEARGDRAEHGRRAEHRAERGERARLLLAGERADQDADALGDQQRPEPALQQPAGDQHGRAGGQAAPERGQGEPGDADQEHAPLAEAVAETAAHHEQDAHGQGVAGAQPFDQRLTAAEVADDGRGGDVGDRRVHQVQHVGQQDDGQDQAQAGGQPGGVRRGCRRVRRGWWWSWRGSLSPGAPVAAGAGFPGG